MVRHTTRGPLDDGCCQQLWRNHDDCQRPYQMAEPRRPMFLQEQEDLSLSHYLLLLLHTFMCSPEGFCTNCQTIFLHEFKLLIHNLSTYRMMKFITSATNSKYFSSCRQLLILFHQTFDWLSSYITNFFKAIFLFSKTFLSSSFCT